jgi:hypothetical protein
MLAKHPRAYNAEPAGSGRKWNIVNRVNYGRAALAVAIVFCAAASAGLTAQAMPTQPSMMRHPVLAPRGMDGGIGASVIGKLHTITTIGSAVDPINGDQNPYGLDIAKVTKGVITAGDLVLCDFNDGFNNIQGLGSTIDVLHPTPGSVPTRLAQDTRLTGCNALALSPTGDNPWVAAFTANDNPILDSSGNFLDTLGGAPFASPWGQAFAGTKGPYGKAAFYESNSNDGSIVRIGITSNGFKPKVIATGFSVNHGVPGTVLAPSGLTYDASIDTLYIVDGNANRVVAFSNVTLIPPKGIVVMGNTFGGLAGSLARVVARGAPLAQPISAALLYNGNIVVGNTSNNLLVEISPKQNAVVKTKNLDKGPAGALFGIAASGTSTATTQIYFNDDNANTVNVLGP